MSDKHMHPWSLKIPIDGHFLGCVSNLTRFTFVTTHIQTKLTDTQFGLFKKLIFGHFLAMGDPRFGDPRFSGNLVHCLLLRLVVKPNFSYCGDLLMKKIAMDIFMDEIM